MASVIPAWTKPFLECADTSVVYNFLTGRSPISSLKCLLVAICYTILSYLLANFSPSFFRMCFGFVTRDQGIQQCWHSFVSFLSFSLAYPVCSEVSKASIILKYLSKLIYKNYVYLEHLIIASYLHITYFWLCGSSSKFKYSKGYPRNDHNEDAVIGTVVHLGRGEGRGWMFPWNPLCYI